MGEITPWVQVLLESAERQGENAKLFSPENLELVTEFIVEYRLIVEKDEGIGPPWQKVFNHLPDHVSAQLREACRKERPDLAW